MKRKFYTPEERIRYYSDMIKDLSEKLEFANRRITELRKNAVKQHIELFSEAEIEALREALKKGEG